MPAVSRVLVLELPRLPDQMVRQFSDGLLSSRGVFALHLSYRCSWKALTRLLGPESNYSLTYSQFAPYSLARTNRVPLREPCLPRDC